MPEQTRLESLNPVQLPLVRRTKKVDLADWITAVVVAGHVVHDRHFLAVLLTDADGKGRVGDIDLFS